MSYFKSAETLKLNKKTNLSGAEARHILKSRRIRIGEKIMLQDPVGERFLAEVMITNKDSLIILPLQKIEAPAESPLKITLFQAVVKEKSFDNILQKTTELGVATIQIWNSQHSPEKISPKFKYKLNRWQKIVDEACKQSGRATPPALSLLDDLSDVVKAGNELDSLIVLDTAGTDNLEKMKNFTSVGVVVGPEGGLDQTELDALRELPNVKIIKFGPRILRADTAAITGVAIINNHFGDLN